MAIDRLAAQVAGFVRRDTKVAVNCMSGLNRSGLLVGRTLIELGHSPEEAVALVRAARGVRPVKRRVYPMAPDRLHAPRPSPTSCDGGLVQARPALDLALRRVGGRCQYRSGGNRGHDPARRRRLLLRVRRAARRPGGCAAGR